MPDIFDEVEEEYRAERTRQFWRRYGVLFGAALFLGLGGLAGWQGWTYWQQRQAQHAAIAYLTAQAAADADGANPGQTAPRFAAVAAESPAGYRTLARLREAALQVQAGDRAAARATLDAVASDSAADPLYRDLASLLWVLHGLDDADPALLAARIAPLTAEGAPWRASARELAALVDLRRGQKAEAKQALTALANDVTAPQGVRERALRLAREIEG
ncbi:MAG TPA: tetratricopeptide repeat protein [Roseomonas sp.]